jgi:hypothetical protein
MKADLLSQFFPPNPKKHGRYLGLAPKGEKKVSTLEHPVTRELVEAHLKGTGGFEALGWLPGDADGTTVGMIDLDVKDFPEPGELEDAWLRLRDVAEALGWHVYPEESTRKGRHVFVFASERVPYAVMRAALKVWAARAGLEGVEVFPKGEDHLSNWIIMPYAGAAADEQRLGNTYLETAEGQPVPYDELDEWIERTDAESIRSLADEYQEASSAQPEAEGLTADALQALKEAALKPPASFNRHDSLIAFLNLARRCGGEDAMADHLKGEEVRAAWLKDGSRDARKWAAEVDRWVKVKASSRERGIPYLKEQGFTIPKLTKTKPAKNGKIAQTICLADVEPQEVSWLWWPYLPLGKVTILEGDPGAMKTFLWIALAASVTRGWGFLDQEGGPGADQEPGNVLFLNAEDGLADTLRPRLDAADADVSRVFALTGWKDEGTDGLVTFADVEVLEQGLKEHRPRLVVVDPVQAYLGARVDINRTNEVRSATKPISDLAEQYGVALLVVRHLSKSPKSKALYDGQGSIDFSAGARSVLRAGEYQGQRLMAHVKCNLAPLGRAMRYEVRDGALAWLGPTDVTADEMRAADQSKESSALDEAKVFLRSYLADDPRPGSDVLKAALAEGISKGTLKRAKAEVGIGSKRQSEGNDGKGTWLWYLQEAQGEQDTPDENLEPLATLAKEPVTDAHSQEAQGNGLSTLRERRAQRENPQEAQGEQANVLEGLRLLPALRRKLEHGRWQIKNAPLLLEYCQRADQGDEEARAAIEDYLRDPRVLQEVMRA